MISCANCGKELYGWEESDTLYCDCFFDDVDDEDIYYPHDDKEGE